MATLNKINGEWVVTAGGQRMWVGTQAAYEAALANGEIAANTLVAITDDSDSNIDDVPTANSENLVKSGGVYNSTITKKDIAATYTTTDTTLEGIIKNILELNNVLTWETNTYAGDFESTHSGGGDTGSWTGAYLLKVVKNNQFGIQGFVSAQGYMFNIHLSAGTFVVNRLAFVE